MLLTGGIASAQVTIHGNVYGGGNKGVILNDTIHQGGDVVVMGIDSATVIINGGFIQGSVYGGGLGDTLAEKAGLVEGNTRVEMRGGTVVRSIYGGGQLGSVGTFNYDTVTYPANDPNNNGGKTVVVPASLKVAGTGRAKVLVSGGRVGVINQALMPATNNPGDDELGWVFCGSQGLADSIKYHKAIGHGVVNDSYLHISGGLITASAYGGCENGLLLDSTYVLVSGGQIGVGHYMEGNVHHWDSVYSEELWQKAIDSIRSGVPSKINAIAGHFHECDAWPYGIRVDGEMKYYVYDIFADPEEHPEYDSHGGSLEGSNGHSFFGNVFGGGSGYYPIAPGVWRRTAGQVKGNTRLEITGGHILTSVYGGNEITDVLGNSTVEMKGGTLGVPRDTASINAHPVTCYLFGASMGDPRILFNKWTDVKQNVYVNVSGGTIFGSVFGGGEDGHVIGNITMNISNDAIIGTWGYSYVDGNVFGGGRGFSGDALTAGSVGGNIDIEISGGTMLGSVYGGGRLASVGTKFAYPTLDNGEPNPDYGQMAGGDDHGNITITITGGTIGNDYESKLHRWEHTFGGNVFGGSMGRLTLLDGSINPLWPDLAKVRTTNITVDGDEVVIKGNVYGGAEYGTVTDTTGVNIKKGTIWRDVYGGGRGDLNASLIGNLKVFGEDQGQATVTEVEVRPIQWAGRVRGNATVNIEGGWVKKSIYGGGEMASVGTVIDSIKHSNENLSFALSWPYQMNYKKGTGLATVNVTGGRVGLTGKDYMGPWAVIENVLTPVYYAESDVNQTTPLPYNLGDAEDVAKLKAAREDNGDVYGGGKGKAGDRYVMAHGTNVNNTSVNVNINSGANPDNFKPTYSDGSDIDYETAFYEKYSDWTTAHPTVPACIPGSLYGGGENGHVLDSTAVVLTKGLVGHNIYGGGKGSDKYETTLNDPTTNQPYQAEVYSIFGGKVYNKTYVTVEDGYVVRNVFGGGNLASVGKGNYAGGQGDYQVDGYGESWANNTALHDTLLNSGHTYVTIKGGTIGTVKGMKDGIPTGNVFGSSRGEPAPNVRQTLTPRIHYYPEFFLGYVNHTHVTIGEEVGTDNGPRIYGSVYGGGQDGHVRWETNVIVNKGEIGNEYKNPNDAEVLVGTNDLNDYQWMGRGSVYGAGLGMGMFKGDDNHDHYSTSAGSVTQFSNVTINGGLIHQNVYGGGPLASVGPPRMALSYDPGSADTTCATVNIYSPIGVKSDVAGGTYVEEGVTKTYTYGGHVFGGSRGVFDFDKDPLLDYEKFATTTYTQVNIGDGALVYGDVYGGGEFGQVKQCTNVDMEAGQVGTIDYTWKTSTTDHTQPYDSIVHTTGGRVFGGGKGSFDNRIAALVHDSTNVNIRGGHVLWNVYGGGEIASVGLRDTIFVEGSSTEVKDFAPKDNTGLASVTITGGQVGPAPKVEEGYDIPVGLNGVDGYVFGGGKGEGNDPTEQYKQFADVNYTCVTIDMPMDDGSHSNRLWGSVFGGSEDGHVLGSDTVHFVNGLLGTEGTTSYDGNIFGGGRNYSKRNYTAGRTRGNIIVEMTGGQLYGSIFGGGRLALTGIGVNGVTGTTIENGTAYKALLDGTDHGQIAVKVSGGKVGNEALMRTWKANTIGDVYGGGKGSKVGIEGHPASMTTLISLVKDTHVEISGSARVYGNVYGGGEVGNVGNYTWNQSGNSVNGIAIIPNTGHAKVTVNGGIIGLDNMQMITESGYPDDFGHVFGGGEGWVESPNSPTNPVIDSEGNHLVECMASVRTTEVTISDEAFVLGSVYGGSDNGHVLDSTWVKIQGGQIGAGENVVDANGHNRPYTDNEWNSASLAECASWTYQEGGNPYDINILNPVTNKPEPGMNGATFYGHVFGGGSGFYPYGVDDDGNSQWLRSSGQVEGNTRVEVTDGHILTSLYGGCETTDVGTYTYDNNIHGEVHVSGGKSTVIISGGTIGVPRDSTSIVNHPVTCHVYGSGKGDPRFFFNTWTNVWDSKVEIKGTAWVYGSVFGGGEEGHVLNNVDLDVSENAKIGTLGYTNVDGNVFGGGRGFTGWALTAGTVGGNIDIDITGGTMLGSVYGGGRLASVGTYLVEKDIPDPENPSQTVINPLYGRFQPGDNHGFIDINISGGTIGNDHEIEKLTHAKPDTKGGNVYGGCMGKFVEKTGDDTPIWPSLARAKETNVTITGTVLVKNSVYGGGEIGTLSNNATVNISGGTIGGNYGTGNFCGHVFGGGRGIDDPAISLNVENDSTLVAAYLAGRVYGNTTVNITGGQVYENVYGGGEVASVGWVKDDGTMVNGLAQVNMTGGIIGPLDGSGLNGFIFGGPKGGNDAAMKAYCNVNNTGVNVGYADNNSNRVWGSLFGGGSDGHVLGDAMVTVTNGTIGTTGITSWDGNVFGGGRNFHEVSETAGRVGGNTTVNILGGHMLGSVFGGGRLGSVGIDVNGDTIVGPAHGYTTVNVGGQFQIGDINFVQTGNIDIGHQITDPSHPVERVGGNVYGGAKGKAGAPGTLVTRVSKVKQTTVNIREKSDFETWIEGSVFGSGEDGHVLKDTYVNIFDGQIGGHDYGDFTPCADPYHGNVYGGGRGVDTYEDPEHPGTFVHSTTAGWVQGNTNVNMYGGHVIRNVYGGGNLASVGNPDEQDPQPGQDYKTGLASVTITGGTVGTTNEDENYGNVFGSAHGGVSGEYVHLAFVKNTHVTIGQTAQIFGSVFGGGEDGHVRKNTLVDIEGGIIGDENDVANQPLDGNVYGGGRGLLLNGDSQSAGEVYGYTTVNIKNSTVSGTNYTPEIWHNVFGGGSQSVVREYKVVNVSGGLVHGSVFGGSREIPEQRPNKAPRWVNMWGGTVEGNVYGCSYYGVDDNPSSNPYDPKGWASFVNISGGTIGTDSNGGIEGGNVYGAGYGGKVKGSVAVLIGKNAIVETSNDTEDEFYGKNIHKPADPVIANLDIKGNVFGGSYGSIGSTDWEHSFNVSGFSRVYIDGTDYNTTIASPVTGTDDYMNIGGGVYGCGTNCESGEKGRNILVRNYGKRNPEGDPVAELTQASRTLTTIQRGDIILLDNTNVNLSGAADISQSDSERAFAVLQVDKGVYVTNASGMVLGAVGAPAYMDSIHEVRSLYLKDNSGTSYDQMDGGDNTNWEWIGIKDSDNHLYRIHATGDPTQLATKEENVIIFNGDSRLYVRYLDESGPAKKRMYGLLQGFFRMRSPFSPRGTESFAYARPKLTPKNNPIRVEEFDNSVDTRNEGDGGFLSYDNGNNFFTQPETVLYYTYTTTGDDGGSIYTKTKQYPYFNIGEYVLNRESSEMDMEEFREWVLPTIPGKIWYVDGRGIGNGGWGKDDYHQLKWGHFPDMPKETITGDMGIYNDINDNSHEHNYEDFSPADDIIYVVGPVEAIKEKENLNKLPQYQLKLYRYPGRHMMSNDQYDETVVVDAEHPATAPDDEAAWNGQTQNSTVGPGANLGMMIHANKTNFVMENVLVDGLFGAEPDDITTHNIPTSFTSTQVYKVNKPMLVVDTVGNPSKQSSLTLKGFRTTTNVSGEIEVVTNGTILQRGYNGIDAAATWYYDADYDCYTESTSGGQQVITVTPQGGGLFVDKDASSTVNVEGLVTIQGNKQRRMVGSDDRPVESNVYLPTFSKSLNITDALTAEDNVKTLIGITSPIRNKADHYQSNTFSPIAVTQTPTIAQNAWNNCNFLDDQNWFFVREDWGADPNHRRTTYYCEGDVEGQVVQPNTLYFGWTWANVVRKQPAGYVESDDNITISTEEGLAWLISQSAGMNGVNPPIGFMNKSISQTKDFDMEQYVWVPVGTDVTPFVGSYDGKGHLIEGLSIEYLGLGDKIYRRTNYGMFGKVGGEGNVNRTFLVSGLIAPESILSISSSGNSSTVYNLGGLVGSLNGTATVSNSESAVKIDCPNYQNANNVVAGGLVGLMSNGHIHSSMAMPDVIMGAWPQGHIGGLVGSSTAGTIYNSFTNARFDVDGNNGTDGYNDGVRIGGLVGDNGTSEATGAMMMNCYAAVHGCKNLSPTNFGSIAASNKVNVVDDEVIPMIDSCYVMQDSCVIHIPSSEHYKFVIIGNDQHYSSCHQYTPVSSADKYGYMYLDNTLKLGEGATVDTVMFRVLNKWVDDNNGSGHTYARWARPGLQEINGDLPVLLIDNYSNNTNAYIGQGDFRSVGTYAGGPALQYGGTVRDGDALNAALTRPLEKKKIDDEPEEDIPDYLFVYGDVDNVGADLTITQSKVSIHEDVSILHPGSLADYRYNYVGITFDNSCGKATSTPGVNYGLNGLGMGGYPLPRDWHMFSTPLQMAPLGFEYYLNADYSSDENNTNRNTYSSGYVGTYYNNIWTNPSTEFSWLNNGGSGDNRYWMKGWVNSQSPRNSSSFDENKWVDGYFPSQYRDRFGEGCIENTDEWGRYPYGMDFYTWTEPDYHWINFKRNGPNHWHTDTRGEDDHWHLEYKPYGIYDEDNGKPKNVNEEYLIVGRGYMASIGTETFMQSHGRLNKDISQSDAGNDAGLGILLTNTSDSKLPGWNLVGNPYHGYLDFNLVGAGNSVLNQHGAEGAFYVVYNADKFDVIEGKASTAFRYYPVNGSINGDYAERYLHPHQGFYVKSGGGALQFTESMLVSRADVGTGGDFRDERPAYPLVNLYLSSDNGCADVTVIEFNRPEWGGARKLKELRVGNGLFYGHHDDENYAALFVKEGTKQVPVRFEAKEDDIFTMKWNTANGDFHSMYLIDNIAGIQYDMLRNDNYIFEGHKSDYKSRFLIVFEVTDVEENLEGFHNFVFFDGSQWIATGEGNLEFIDLLGHVLWSERLTGGQTRISLPEVAKSLYMFRLTNAHETKVQKVLVK